MPGRNSVWSETSCSKGVAEVELEMPCAVMLDLGGRARTSRSARFLPGGVTESVSLMQNRMGATILWACFPGRYRMIVGATRAATSLRNVLFGGSSAPYPGSASGRAHQCH